MGEAVHEVVIARLVRAALRHAGHPVSPVGRYALIDLGVDVLDVGGQPVEPAVLLVRQACPRPEFQWGRRDPGEHWVARLLDIELTMRRYGITASCSGALCFHLRRRGDRLEVLRDGVPDDVPPGGVTLYRFDEAPDVGRAIV